MTKERAFQHLKVLYEKCYPDYHAYGNYIRVDIDTDIYYKALGIALKAIHNEIQREKEERNG